MTFRRLDEVKVLRDPVHGYIHVELQVIWDLLNSSWFQRLRRIRQLGGAYMVYHCAEHSRFSHSLGVYEIVRRMVTEIGDIRDALTEREKVTVMAAALLHDIGHGPYSHAFETVTGTSHESFTCRIIEENTGITEILETCSAGLAKETADVIRHRSPNPLLHQLISSQLDADRMDYLLRDAYFTGTKYGEFDLERILRTLRVEEGNLLVVKGSGMYAVENYIMARYHMYWQVYYHPAGRSYEYILHALFRRIREMKDTDDPSMIPLFGPLVSRKKIELNDYFALDENSISYGFEKLTSHRDPVIRDLAARIRDRNLFKYTDDHPAVSRRIRAALKKEGYDLKYYFGRDSVEQNPYIPYDGNDSGAVWVRMADGRILELSSASNIVYSLIHGPAHDDNKIFFPGEICGSI